MQAPRSVPSLELLGFPTRPPFHLSPAMLGSPNEGGISRGLRCADPSQSKVATLVCHSRRPGSPGLPGMLQNPSGGRVSRPQRTGVWGAEHSSPSVNCGPPPKRGSEPGLVTCTAFKAAGVRGLPGQVGSIPTRFRQLSLSLGGRNGLRNSCSAPQAPVRYGGNESRLRLVHPINRMDGWSRKIRGS